MQVSSINKFDTEHKKNIIKTNARYPIDSYDEFCGLAICITDGVDHDACKVRVIRKGIQSDSQNSN